MITRSLPVLPPFVSINHLIEHAICVGVLLISLLVSRHLIIPNRCSTSPNSRSLIPWHPDNPRALTTRLQILEASPTVPLPHTDSFVFLLLSFRSLYSLPSTPFPSPPPFKPLPIHFFLPLPFSNLKTFFSAGEC